jgi:hypothetical protein
MVEIINFNCLEAQVLNGFEGFFGSAAIRQDCLAKVIGKKVKVADCSKYLIVKAFQNYSNLI